MCSPLFIVQLTTFSLANVSQNLMLNVANDLMLSSSNVKNNETTFEDIQLGALNVITDSFMSSVFGGSI